MRIIMKRAVGAALGTIAFGGASLGAASAADIPVPQAQVQPPPPSYYPPPAPPPPREGYVNPPPVAYAYPPVAYEYPPPPPPVYYDDVPPPVVVVPRPYYLGRRFVPFYGEHLYGRWGYGPYVARGYGRFEHEWGRRGW
jgi:hypothetical protein